MPLDRYAQRPKKTFNMIKNTFLLALCALSLNLVGCASKPQIKSGARFLIVPDTYIVKTGDSLSAIAARYGMDYTKVADLNNIAPPYRIYVNQRIRLKSSALSAAPIQTQALSPVAEIERQKVDTTASSTVVAPVTAEIVTKTLPKPVTAQSSAQVSGNNPLNNNVISSNTNTDLTWTRPTAGAILQGFDPDKDIKGIRFSGQVGDAVLAAANGQVVYADNGLKEYGNLVLIKHSDGYITAYAHNSKLLVKKGENVSAGQKIAEMGASGSAMVMLEFQVRLNGKPIDPRTVLRLN